MVDVMDMTAFRNAHIGYMRQCGIPDYMHGGMIRYWESGIEPGSFLLMVLENDLRGAVMCADSTNAANLSGYGNYLNWYGLPQASGNRAAVVAWMAKGGAGVQPPYAG